MKNIHILILTAAITSAAIFSFSKGFATSAPSDHLLFYLINYDHGFIRRALLGQIVGFFVDQTDLPAVERASSVFLGATSISLLLIIAGWFWWLVASGRNLATLSCVFALFATSQLLPILGMDPNYLDVYDYFLVLLAALALTRGAAWVAAIIGFIGPFLHIAIIFPWGALILLEIWRSKPRNATLLLTPVISTLICYLGASRTSAAAELASLPINEAFRQFALTTIFDQTFWQNLKIMIWKHAAYPLNVLVAWCFYCAPAAMIVGLYGSTRRRDWLVLILCTLTPTAIFAVGGWEITRFTSATALMALITVFYMETFRPLAGPIRNGWLIVGFVLAGINLFVPATLAFFEVAGVIDRGPIKVANFPLTGPLVHGAVSFYSRFVGSRSLDADATGSAPGATWYESEDAWENIWVRRPGTDSFDGYFCKQAGCFAGALKINQNGERIVIQRMNSDGSVDFKMVGTRTGNRAQGTYFGGRWFATISEEHATEDEIRRLLRSHKVGRICRADGHCIAAD